jgi:hypothetical protein
MRESVGRVVVFEIHSRRGIYRRLVIAQKTGWPVE